MRYNLKKPIKVGEEKYTFLELDEPSMRSLRKHKVTIPNGESCVEFTIESMARMICACCSNVAPVFLDELKPADIIEAYTICSGFLAEESA